MRTRKATMKGRTTVERRKKGTVEFSPGTFASLSEDSDSSRQSALPTVGHHFRNLSMTRPQAKLTVSQPGDRYEMEADQVTDQIMRMEKPDDETKSTIPQIARKAQTDLQPADDVTPIAQAGLQSDGQPLDVETRAFMEPRFGHDFSEVRVHTDSLATQSAESLNAIAYTVGQDVVFAEGRYEPETRGGKHLLAHELTHVLQQGNAVGHEHQLQPKASNDSTHDQNRIATVHAGEGNRKIMRETPSGLPDPAQGLVVPIKFSIEQQLGAGASAGPFKFKPKIKGDATAKMLSAPATGQSQTKFGGAPIAGDPNQKSPSSSTKLEVGAKTGAGEAGASAELKHECEKRFLGFTPELKGTGEWTTKGGKISVGITLSDKFLGDYKVSLKPIEVSLVKWKTGETPEILVASVGADLTIPEFEHVTQSGLRFLVEMKPGLSVDITPDYISIGEWVLEQLGAEALAAIGALALPAASAAVIVAAFYYGEQEGRDIGWITFDAAKALQNYSQSYANVMTGTEPTAGAGGAEGAQRAQTDLSDLKQKYPEEVVTKKVREAGIYGKVVDIAKPLFRERAIEEFKKRHSIRVALFGIPPSFYENLDARLTHIGSKSDEKWIGTRDDEGNI